MVTEKPVGICPACGQTVFASQETPDGPVWTCPRDLAPQNAFWHSTFIREEDQQAAGVYSNCPDDFGIKSGARGRYLGVCELEHLPLHARCYEKGTW